MSTYPNWNVIKIQRKSWLTLFELRYLYDVQLIEMAAHLEIFT